MSCLRSRAELASSLTSSKVPSRSVHLSLLLLHFSIQVWPPPQPRQAMGARTPLWGSQLLTDGTHRAAVGQRPHCSQGPRVPGQTRPPAFTGCSGAPADLRRAQEPRTENLNHINNCGGTSGFLCDELKGQVPEGDLSREEQCSLKRKPPKVKRLTGWSD